VGGIAIGICAAVERARWAAWEIDVNLSPRTYSDAVSAAGATPLVLPPDDRVTAAPDRVLDLLAGVLIAGGGDLDPRSYGAESGSDLTGVRPERDRFELALARHALERELPVLGVCRGMEVLNVALGGTLEQSLPNPELHLHTPGRYSDHEVRLEPGSRAAEAAGAERISVRSHHHQGIGVLGEGLVATGHSVPDGVVEAVELPERWALGVLWHAEEERPSPVVASLVAAARGNQAPQQRRTSASPSGLRDRGAAA
jgi:putative glutamine amidotransferase